MKLEVKSVASLLGTPVSYAYAVKAGPWLFLTGHEAWDWRTGAIDETVAGPPSYPLFGTSHRSRREADFIFNRMRGVLQEFGSDFAHAIRLDQYYPNPRAVAAYHLARHDAFADYIPPSTSVVMDRVFGDQSTISTSLIAVVPEAGYEIRKIHPPGVASAPTSGFVPAVVCNEFVFVAGQMAHNPGTGLDPRADLVQTGVQGGLGVVREAGEVARGHHRRRAQRPGVLDRPRQHAADQRDHQQQVDRREPGRGEHVEEAEPVEQRTQLRVVGEIRLDQPDVQRTLRQQRTGQCGQREQEQQHQRGAHRGEPAPAVAQHRSQHPQRCGARFGRRWRALGRPGRRGHGYSTGVKPAIEVCTVASSPAHSPVRSSRPTATISTPPPIWIARACRRSQPNARTARAAPSAITTNGNPSPAQ